MGGHAMGAARDLHGTARHAAYAANVPLLARQAGLELAQAWGGGMISAVDGMRFVVPVPAVFARPNRKYFGPKRGMTWLNAMSERASAAARKSWRGPCGTPCT